MRNLDPALVARRGLSAWTVSGGAWPDTTPPKTLQKLPPMPRCCEALQGVGLPGGAALARVRRHRRRDRVLRRVARASAHTLRVRDRRRRHQAERPRRCASGSAPPRSSRAGRRRSSSRREQARSRCCIEIEVNIGRTGAATPFADARADCASPGRRSRWRRCTTPTTSPQGHPRGRHGDHREGRRRHPARGRARRIADAARPTRAVGDADRLSGVRQPAAQAPKTRRSGAARTARARRSCGAASSTSRRAAR